MKKSKKKIDWMPEKDNHIPEDIKEMIEDSLKLAQEMIPGGFEVKITVMSADEYLEKIKDI